MAGTVYGKYSAACELRRRQEIVLTPESLKVTHLDRSRMIAAERCAAGLAIAAPSMKAALEAWGADSNLFHQAAAKQSDDPDVIAAMAAPGVILRRPVGSRGAFKEHAELPSDLAGGSTKANRKSASARSQKHPKRTEDEAADPKAALGFEKEQKRRERERAKEEAARRKERERGQRAVDKAQSALDVARRKHEKSASDIQAELETLEERSRAEEARWQKERTGLEAALRRARG
jgi:hypothetical protein